MSASPEFAYVCVCVKNARDALSLQHVPEGTETVNDRRERLIEF